MNDKQLVKLARGFRSGLIGKRDSRGMCFMVCAPLRGLLSVYGVVTELREITLKWTNHFVIVLEDGRVLDPTADQFDGLPPIYVGPMPKYLPRTTTVRMSKVERERQET